MAGRKRQSADERKPAILKAFYEVIEAEGFENASVAKVAKQAGVHASLIIHYFGSKEKMVMALVDEVLRTYAALFARLPEGGDPEERLECLLSLIWSREWYEAASFSVVFSFLALSQRDAEVMERVRNLYGNYRRYLNKQMALLSDAGVIRVDDPQATTEALISLSEGSHYFCQYHIKAGTFDAHCAHMIRSARLLLGTK
ncbi:TetR/AcrR family transcriptional regulator [Desulfoluna spongiiphila]|uniref:Biofilm operon icaADBC HTH-type negative transcriptional regulator IcaR n=1 Tax=Desulfoluna spongiiphila TaxID=419481 RepID=A0A1G5AN96_9BACT|nr:TetR family transcriptional regulator [Desulfoluna spongiiphila]SCX79356.1 transcriptional regulator, TetR family [Desulfoluna spongiiphila]